MKTIKLLIALTLVLSLGIINYLSAQSTNCYGLNENDFPQTCVSTEGTSPPSATFDYDFVTNTAGTYTGGADGTDDVTVTMNAVCNFPNGTNGSTYIAACLGPNGLDNFQNGANASCGGAGYAPNISGGSDFGGATCDDAPCTNCYVEVCYDYINGFSSDAAGFNVDFSSMNGSTEGYEAIVGWVEGVDNTGAPFNTNLITPGDLANFCPSVVVAGQTPSQFLTGTAAGGTLPPGVFAADAVTADGTATLCPTEEPGSSSGPDSSADAVTVAGPNLGLNPDDIITRSCMVYILSNSNADDCDADGETSVNSNPSGSLADVDICVPLPACDFTADVTLQDVCGSMQVCIENAVASGGAIDYIVATSTDGIAFDATTITSTNTGTTPGATQVCFETNITSDGTTPYYIQLQDSADNTCTSDFGPFTSPAGGTPFITTFHANP